MQVFGFDNVILYNNEAVQIYSSNPVRNLRLDLGVRSNHAAPVPCLSREFTVTCGVRVHCLLFCRTSLGTYCAGY